MNQKHIVTYKEIAGMIGFSVRTVRRRYDELGLGAARVQWQSKRIYFVRSKVVHLLRCKGLVE